MEREKIEGRKAAEYQDPGKEDDLGHRAGKPGLILYLDTSAIVKKYIPERGSAEIIQAIATAQSAGSALIARAEVAGALSKAVRLGILTDQAGQSCLKAFRKEYTNYYWSQVSVAVVSRAETFAWTHRLRGYDAVHLAAASAWQDDLGLPVTVATFDLNLWTAARIVGLLPYPGNLPALLEEWRA